MNAFFCKAGYVNLKLQIFKKELEICQESALFLINRQHFSYQKAKMRKEGKNRNCDGNCSRFTNKATKSRCTKSFLQNLARPTQKTMYLSLYLCKKISYNDCLPYFAHLDMHIVIGKLFRQPLLEQIRTKTNDELTKIEHFQSLW